MQSSITNRLISVLTEVEMEDMYHQLASKLGKSQLEKSEETAVIKELPELKIDLGALCKRKRERLGLTVYAVAKNSGILQNQVKAIEEGQGYNIDALLKLTASLELNVMLNDAKNSV
jgi:ribosome-binding protein aMBF1 (putative translation factor)